MHTLYLHGLGQTPDSWKATIQSGRNPAIPICPDLFHLSEDTEKTYENLYHAFAGYCEQFKEPFNLCGLSLGGMVALQYAMEPQEKVRAMALIGTPCRMPKGLLHFQNLLFRFMPERTFLGMGLSKEDTICFCRSMTKIHLEDYQKITSPVLVLCGEKDRANQRAAAELAGRIPGAAAQSVPHAGHEVNIQAPEELARILDAFFSV